MSDDVLKELEVPCCGILVTTWYIGADGKQRFICPRCRSVYAILPDGIQLENDKRIKVVKTQ